MTRRKKISGNLILDPAYKRKVKTGIQLLRDVRQGNCSGFRMAHWQTMYKETENYFAKKNA